MMYTEHSLQPLKIHVAFVSKDIKRLCIPLVLETYEAIVSCDQKGNKPVVMIDNTGSPS